MLFGFLKNFLILVVLIGLLLLITHFSPTLKKQADTQFAKVLGSKTEKNSNEKPLPDSLKEDAKDQVNAVKNQAMHTNLDDVFQAINRFQKIPKDAQATLEETRKTVEGFFKHK